MMAVLLTSFLILACISDFIDSNIYSQSFIIVLVSIIVVNLILNMAIRKKVDFKIRALKGTQKGKPATLEISMRNRSSVPVITALLPLKVLNTFTGEKEIKRIKMSAMPKSVSKAIVKVKGSHCGKINCSITSPKLCDLLSITRVKVFSKVHCNYTVFPDIFDSYVEYELQESDIYDCENYSQQRKGRDPSQVFQIREYMEGDSIKQIHWKLSSKLDNVVVRDASLPIDKNILVVWDKGIIGEKCSADGAEAMAETAFSICCGLIEEGLSFKVIWNNAEEQYCYSEDIQYQEELAGLMPQLLGEPVLQTEMTCAELWNKTGANLKATHVIYVTCNNNAGEESFFAGSRFVRIDARDANYREIYRYIKIF